MARRWPGAPVSAHGDQEKSISWGFCAQASKATGAPASWLLRSARLDIRHLVHARGPTTDAPKPADPATSPLWPHPPLSPKHAVLCCKQPKDHIAMPALVVATVSLTDFERYCENLVSTFSLQVHLRTATFRRPSSTRVTWLEAQASRRPSPTVAAASASSGCSDGSSECPRL